MARFDANTTHPDLAVVLDESGDCVLVRQFYHKSTSLEIDGAPVSVAEESTAEIAEFAEVLWNSQRFCSTIFSSVCE